MSANSIRWRISEAVRRKLFRLDENHPLGRLYRILRAVPGVTQVWRLIDRRRPTARAFAKYVSGGGSFGPDAPHDPACLPPVVPFEHPDFFSNLIARIVACEPRPETATDTIVLVNNGLSAGGAERQIVSTMLGLKARSMPAVFIGEYLDTAPGHDFHLASLAAAGADARALKRVTLPGSRVFASVSKPVAAQLFRIEPSLLLEILDMVVALRVINPRVVHLWQDETSVKHAISALIAGVPRIVLSGRNLNPPHFAYHRHFMRPAYLALLAQRSVVLSNNSHAGAASYAEWLGIDPARITVIHNGFDLGVWASASDTRRHEARKALGIPADGILVAGAFRLSPEKRPLLWIETAAAALKVEPRLHFAIAGEGDMRRAVETRIGELGIDRRIRLAGRMSDVHALFMACDAFMLTSEQEGIPNVLLEAQWYGRPVLATPAGGVAEAMQDGITGRISHESEPAALARALVDLTRDHVLKRSAQAAGPAFIIRTFSVDSMIDKVLSLYQA
jgi:glycosyltransferase involved in cell wall biosynthesis